MTKPYVDRVWFSGLVSHFNAQKCDFSLYLGDCLFHLVLCEVGYGGLKVVYNGLKAVTLQYFSFMAAQQAQGHLKNHLCALDK